MYIRSILEQSSVVWHSSLTEENSSDLERIQKCAVKIILGKRYNNYEDALQKVDLPTLNERREELCLNFGRKCIKNEKTKTMFPERVKIHQMLNRNEEKFEVKHANTERFLKSAIPHMQRLLNDEKNNEKDIRISSRMPK